MTRRLLRLSLVLLPLLAAGCSDTGPVSAGGVDGAAVWKEGIDNFNQTAEVLATITDEDTAEAAVVRLAELDHQRQQIEKKLNTFEQQATGEQMRALEARYGKRMTAAGERMQAERRRAEALPGVRQVFAEAAAVAQFKHPTSVTPDTAMPALDFGTEMDLTIQAARQHREQRLQELIQEHGKDQLTTVAIEGLGTGYFGFANSRMSDLARAEAFGEYQRDKPYIVRLIPFADVRGLAEKIDFGRVSNVDPVNRSLYVRVDPAKLPPPLPPMVHDPDDPDFCRQNVADLTCFDRLRRASAAGALGRVEQPVAQFQEEAARALEGMLSDHDAGIRMAAAQALAVWGSSENVPALIPLLKDDNAAVLSNTLRALTALKDPRSAQAVAEVLFTNHRSLAVDCLKAVGPAAEPAVLQHAKHPEMVVRMAVFGVLEEIATTESVPTLVEMLNAGERTGGTHIFTIFARLKDERTVEPVARVAFGPNPGGSPAEDCLREMGPMVEPVTAGYLTHEDRYVRNKAVRVISAVATKESVPQLIACMQLAEVSSDLRPILDILARLKDERALQPIAMLLLDTSSRSSASRCLIEFGPAAEEIVLKGFEYQDVLLAIECCRILQEIGTEKSFDTLLRLTRVRDPSLRAAAQRAGQAITARVGPPGRSAGRSERGQE